MKTYKVLRAWEGVKVGMVLKSNPRGAIVYEDIEGGYNLTRPNDVAVLLHLEFIEEVGAVKKERFVPKHGEKYWYVGGKGRVDWVYNAHDMDDDELIRIGNCYRTEAEALEARERVLKAY